MVVVSLQNAYFINSVVNWSYRHDIYDHQALMAFQSKLKGDVKYAKGINKVSLLDDNQALISIDDEDRNLVSHILKCFGERNGRNS